MTCHFLDAERQSLQPARLYLGRRRSRHNVFCPPTCSSIQYHGTQLKHNLSNVQRSKYGKLNLRRRDKKRYGISLIKKFIRLANLLPDDEGLPSVEEIPERFVATNRGGVSYPYPRGRAGNLLKQLEEGLPKALSCQRMTFEDFRGRFPYGPAKENGAFYWGIPPSGSEGWVIEAPFCWAAGSDSPWRDMIYNPGQLYRLCRSVRATLDELVKAKGGDGLFTLKTTFRSIYVNEDGTIGIPRDAYNDGFIAAIEGVEIDRFRRCPICGNFYFAQPRHKGACSPKCLIVHRGRTFRSKEKSREYAAGRRFRRKAGLKGLAPGEGKQARLLTEAVKQDSKD